MTTEPSSLIFQFVAAMNARDTTGFLALITPEACVHDEGHVHQGPAQIQAWIEKAWASYRPHLTLQDVLSTGESTVFLGEVSGTFPGSPIVLKHELTLQAGLIKELRIAP